MPVFRDLNRALNLKGKHNDLADATGYLPALEKRAADAIPITVELDAGLPGQPRLPPPVHPRI